MTEVKQFNVKLLTIKVRYFKRMNSSTSLTNSQPLSTTV